MEHLISQNSIRLMDFVQFKARILVNSFPDPEQAKQLENKIITNELITNHVLNCTKCIEQGLENCKEFEHLIGVWD